MSTFSQLVDDVIRESKRPDMLDEICAYLNQTIREIHFRADTNAPLFFRENFKELQVLATGDSGFIWKVPNPATFQGLVAVQYADVYDRVSGQGTFARERIPQRNGSTSPHFFYRVGNQYVFSGYGGGQVRINLGYYEFPPRLQYLLPAQRPAEWDDFEGWSYAAGVVTPEQKAAAEERVTNWLILRWRDIVAEGVRAKIYKRVSDDVRQRTSYALYQQQRQGLWTTEFADLGGAL